MVRAVKHKPKSPKKTFLIVLMFFCLVATGVTLCEIPLSIQGTGGPIQSMEGKDSSHPGETLLPETTLRGSIYDRNFKELGVSYNLYNLYVRPAEINDQPQVAEQISSVLKRNPESLSNLFKQPQHVIQLAENLDKGQVEELGQLKLAGVYCKAVETRFYPEHLTAAHLVGFTENNIGLAGTESMFDPVLQPGVFKNTDLPQLDLSTTQEQREVTLGQTVTDIVLSVDVRLQNKIDFELEKYLQNKKLLRGVALVMDPRNGEVLSMSGMPSYNPNYFWQTDDHNRQDQTAVKFIEPELIRPILVGAAATLKNNGQDNGLLPIFVAAPDYGLSENELGSYSTILGLYKRPECELPSCNEAISEDSTIQAPATRRRYSPIQIATVVASLINGGKKITPFYLKAIYDHNSDSFFKRIQPLDAQKKSRRMSPTMGVRVRRALAAAPIKKIDDFLILRKTTTKVLPGVKSSTYINQDFLLGWGGGKIPNRLLLVAIQYADLYPRAVKDKERSNSLEETAIKIMRFSEEDSAMAATTKIQFPFEKDPYNYQQFLISRKLGRSKPVLPAGQAPMTMPDITGLSLRKALQCLNSLNLKIQVKGSGRIVDQIPRAEKSLDGINKCTLILETEPLAINP